MKNSLLKFLHSLNIQLLLTFLVFGVIFQSRASAIGYTIDGTNIGTAQLSGVNAGNKTNFDVDINLGSMPTNLRIDSAILQFTTTGTSTGSLYIVDKYRPVSSNLIDIKSLSNEGIQLTGQIYSNVQDWYANSSHNYGINFQAKNFTDNDNIIFSGIKLVLTTSEKASADSLPPVIINKSILNSGAGVYTFVIDTDEPSNIMINIGKTSIYGQIYTDNLLANSHTIPILNLLSGITYHYKIVVSDQNGNSTKTTDNTYLTSNIIQSISGDFIVDPTLFPPNNLSNELSKEAGLYSVDLTWTPPANDVFDGYIIYRKLSELNNYVEIGKAGQTALGYTDDTVEQGQKYDYSIRTYKANKISSEAAVIKVEIPSATTDSSSLKPQSTYNTGQVLLILLAVAIIVYLIVYAILRFFPKIFLKDPKKQALKNILKDPSLYEKTVSAEFGSQTSSDPSYPDKDPISGTDMN